MADHSDSLVSSVGAHVLDFAIRNVAAGAANNSAHGGGHGGHHEIAKLCDDKIPSCRLQKPADCDPAVENCSNLITALIFPFFAIAIGIFLQPVTKYIKALPYTLFLLFSGFLIGILGCLADLGMLNTSLLQWVDLNPPNLFFYIFLAPLIFEAAFVNQWHIFKGLLIPILTAAFAIVILQVGLIGGFTMLVVTKDQGWNWWSALMFGAMLSATDPISVTATLNALGASENLGTMIEGESLVNEGSTFVLLETLFRNSEAFGDPYIDKHSVPTIIGIIAKSAFGGMFLGILFAIVALLILTFVYDEFEMETSLTVVVAFLGFWAAQSPAKLSGVICNDREIRRRMLMGMLSHVRRLSNAIVVEYCALVSMEEDIMTAIDENDEEREYDLFKVLNRKSFFNKVLSHFFDEKKFDAELVVIATVVYQIFSEILKQEGLRRSERVNREAMNLYEGAAYMLNRLETHNFKAYRWILSQFAVHTVIAKQDATLHDMHHGGVIDAYERKILSRELQDVCRRHSVNARSVWKKAKKSPGDLVSYHQLFGDKLLHFTELTKLLTVTVRAGHRLRLEEGTLVVVVKGALCPIGRNPPKMSDRSSGDASSNGIGGGNS